MNFKRTIKNIYKVQWISRSGFESLQRKMELKGASVKVTKDGTNDLVQPSRFIDEETGTHWEIK